jgi:NADH:ubiquinone oxidoreductase subunit 2 (subunit N)
MYIRVVRTMFLDDPLPTPPRVQEHYSVHGEAKYITTTVIVITSQTFINDGNTL